MSHAPSTFKGGSDDGGFDWDETASLHRAGDGGGVLGEFKSVRHGTLAELVQFVVSLPEEHRADYVIEKPGDHRLELGEILALSRRDDYPG